MALLEDFKKFAFKGNVVDLAVGVIIGAAFGKIVSALVADIIMPIVGLVMPAGDWRSAGIIVRQGAKPEDNLVLKWGDFLGTIIDFLIVAIALFFIVSSIIKTVEKKMEKPKAEESPKTKTCPFCREDIAIEATRCKFCTSEQNAAAAA